MLIPLHDRAVVQISGPDRFLFLQGLVTQDMRPLEHTPSAVYSAALNAQGRMLWDMIIAPWHSSLWLDVDLCNRDALIAHLKRYQLRQRVEIQACDTTQYQVWSVQGAQDLEQSYHENSDVLMYQDPRYHALGYRLLCSQNPQLLEPFKNFSQGTKETYRALRIEHGIPTYEDWDFERSTPLEIGLDDLHAINWDKGCYIGQELTARTKYRGMVRKRLFPVSFENRTPPSHTPVTWGNEEVGVIRSIEGQRGIALLRVYAVAASRQAQEPLRADLLKVHPHDSPWMRIPPEDGGLDPERLAP